MDQETETLLKLVSRTIRFATYHPYAATGIFGAAVGSAVTYKVLTTQLPSGNILTPKAYELALSSKDLRHLLEDPEAELRWETPEVVVVITPEKREPLKELPVIDIDETPN
jgi:hypothetical protein